MLGLFTPQTATLQIIETEAPRKLQPSASGPRSIGSVARGNRTICPPRIRAIRPPRIIIFFHLDLEIESGKRNDRSELEKAIEACKKHRARLIIAKLDRLSRNVAFIATLCHCPRRGRTARDHLDTAPVDAGCRRRAKPSRPHDS
jgi:hypothetical protein